MHVHTPTIVYVPCVLDIGFSCMLLSIPFCTHLLIYPFVHYEKLSLQSIVILYIIHCTHPITYTWHHTDIVFYTVVNSSHHRQPSFYWHVIVLYGFFLRLHPTKYFLNFLPWKLYGKVGMGYKVTLLKCPPWLLKSPNKNVI
jgi:hypothetical protein